MNLIVVARWVRSVEGLNYLAVWFFAELGNKNKRWTGKQGRQCSLLELGREMIFPSVIYNKRNATRQALLSSLRKYQQLISQFLRRGLLSKMVSLMARTLFIYFFCFWLGIMTKTSNFTLVISLLNILLPSSKNIDIEMQVGHYYYASLLEPSSANYHIHTINYMTLSLSFFLWDSPSDQLVIISLGSPKEKNSHK